MGVYRRYSNLARSALIASVAGGLIVPAKAELWTPPKFSIIKSDVEWMAAEHSLGVITLGMLAAKVAAAAIPTFVAVGAGNSDTGNVVFDAPAGIAANDILWLVVETNDTETVTTPTGFAHVTGSPSEATDTIIHVMWKRATGSETTVTVTDPGNHMIGQMYAFRGCTTTGNPWDVTSASVQNTASTSVSIAGTTTTVANTLVVLCAATGRDTATAQFSGWANASLANLTERGQYYSTTSGGGGEVLVTGEKAAAGATGTTTATLATSDRYAWVIAALKP